VIEEEMDYGVIMPKCARPAR